MSELFDKAILIGIGLEKKAKEVLEELQKAGSEVKSEGADKEGLSGKQILENKVVEEGVKTLKEFLSTVSKAKEKLEEELVKSSGRVLEKLHVAKDDEIDIVKEMARVAREKVDKLEKRIEELETLLKKNG